MRFAGLASVGLMLVFAVGCAPKPTYTYTPSAYSPPPPAPEATLQPGEPVALSAQQQQAVRAGTMKRLKDPESARFGKLSATRDRDGSITVCGFVNAKNSYGGYTGMSPFMGAFLKPPNGGTYEVVRIASSDSERQAVISVCGQAGVPLSQ